MKSKLQAILSILMVVVFVFSLTACESDNTRSNRKTKKHSNNDEKIGLQFESVDVYGNSISSDIMRDAKVVLINLWEPWCGPCVNELPELQRLYENYKDEGLLIIGAYTTQDNAKEIINAKHVTYPTVLCDENLLSLQQSYVPASYIYDNKGNLLCEDVIEGARNYSSWESIILQYLNGWFKMQKRSTIITLIISIALIGEGIIQNQYSEVFAKAGRICLECIGIG